MRWVGVDVGGTFTDVAVYDEARGTLEVAKAPTSPADPTQSLLHALAKRGRPRGSRRWPDPRRRPR